jgi:nitrogen fixation protein FixH
MKLLDPQPSPPGPEETASSRARRPAPALSRAALFYMLLPVLLLGASVVGWLVMVSLAVDDPGFAVEANYYKKAARYGDEVTQRGTNERLGWQLSVERFVTEPGGGALLRLALRDRAGAPISAARVEVEAFPNARAADVKSALLEAAADGAYEARLGRARLGLWEVRARVEAEGERFTAVLRPELASGVSR